MKERESGVWKEKVRAADKFSHLDAFDNKDVAANVTSAVNRWDDRMMAWLVRPRNEMMPAMILLTHPSAGKESHSHPLLKTPPQTDGNPWKRGFKNKQEMRTDRDSGGREAERKSSSAATVIPRHRHTHLLDRGMGEKRVRSERRMCGWENEFTAENPGHHHHRHGNHGGEQPHLCHVRRSRRHMAVISILRLEDTQEMRARTEMRANFGTFVGSMR